jgi:sugar/nucleoside kinase (ribokinase family)
VVARKRPAGAGYPLPDSNEWKHLLLQYTKTEYTDGATLDGAFVPPFVVQVVDTTGAGDAFIGRLLAGLLQGKLLSPELLVYSHAVAGIVVSRTGALNAMFDSVNENYKY